MSSQKSPVSSHELFELIAQDAIMGVIVFERTTQACVYVNRLARESLELGLSDENETTLLTLNELYPSGSRNANIRPFSDVMTATEGYSQDVLIRKANGLSIIANVSVKHVRLADGATFVLVMFQDITFQKKLQREVEAKQDEIKSALNQVLEQNKQLLALDSAKDRFIALTTHELRTPLSAIVATSEVLQLKLYESEQQKEEFIQMIHEQGLHLMELVNDILDFAKIRAGKMEFYIEQMELSEVVSKFASAFENMALQSQVSLHVEKPAENCKVYVDSLRLKEVVSNVVNNAIKYNRPGGKVVVSFEVREEGKIARVIITDTGLGIAADKLHHVFNEFETVGHVSRHHKGTGLGMPISKRLMQAMGGDLSLESKENVGTSFFIDLPTEKVLADEFYRSRVDTWSDLAA